MNARIKKTLLLVEDDPAQLAEYTVKLEGLGYLVHGVASAEDGIRLAKHNHVDLILTDNVLPGMTGVRSILEFAKCSKAPVLLMTSHYSKETESDALALGAKCCLKKPLDFGLMAQELQRAVAA